MGTALGAETVKMGEVCFNTSITGYQEIMTDPSYKGQIINFTFPHIGNVGANDCDIENTKPCAEALITREDITEPSNWRSQAHFNNWLEKFNIPGVCAIDTRSLTKIIRDQGNVYALISHQKDGMFDIDLLKEKSESYSPYR